MKKSKQQQLKTNIEYGKVSEDDILLEVDDYEEVQKDKHNPNLKPIDNMGKWITFNWVSSMIKLVKKQKKLYTCDIPPISYKLKSSTSGRELKLKWDELRELERNNKKLKKSGILKILFKSNQYILWLFLLIPITSFCGLCSPIALNAVTGFLWQFL